MGYQFIHIESYCVKSKKKTGQKAGGSMTWSTKDILDEATREEGACPHVEEPRDPKWLIGSRREIDFSIKDWMSEKSATGRKRREDSSVLLAGVISLSAENKDFWEDYKKECLDYLKKKYGDNLKGVVEHLDESNPHIHFYAVPKPNQEYEDIHEGQKAYNKAKAEKQNFITARAQAMSGLQAEFHEAVSEKFGLNKLGPKRERMTREGWKKEKEFQRMKLEIIEEEKKAILEKKTDIIEKAKRKGEEILEQALNIKRNIIPADIMKALEKCMAAQQKTQELLKDGRAEEAKRVLEQNKEHCEKAKQLDEMINPEKDNGWKRKNPT